jgi:DNA topoisomerase-1
VARSLVIVESPAKAKTLGRFLGAAYAVRASLGHVRDLPKERLAVDTERGFAVEYELIAGRRKLVDELREAARGADTVFLAADPDREGEAICWHLAEVLGGARRRFRRVSFHEITRRAVEEAFRAPRALDERRVDAQQARRILDRLVGYSLSPLLWREVQRGLSAGRVQSVALRLVCDRERAIRAFVPEEYWTIRAQLHAGTPPVFPATLHRIGGADAVVRSAREAEAVRGALERAHYRVLSVERRVRRRPPAPPFVTSTLQQEAFGKLRFGVKKTMQVAQRLYEGVELAGEGSHGLITYMRTDSVRVAPEAAAAARAHVARVFGEEYVPEREHAFRSARAAQEAHEAIRPTDLARTPDALAAVLGKDELALYRLIFDRFLASQMAAAVYDETHVAIEARPPDAPDGPPSHGLRAKGSTLRFRGFLAAYEEAAAEPGHENPAERQTEATPLPPLEAGQPLELRRLDSEQKFTEPAPRFSEASLVKELERCGIGRPSTYASILATLFERKYVEKEKGRLRPTRVGFSVTDLLVARFPDLMSVTYTASLEECLDAIEEGRATALATLDGFWQRLKAQLHAARVPGPAAAEPTVPAPRAGRGRGKGRAPEPAGPEPEPDVPESGLGVCPDCARALVRREGRYGPFVGCSGFPRCRYIQRKPTTAAGIACPRCNEGQLVERSAAGRTFYGCARYPSCRFTSSDKLLPESCPECGRAYLLEKQTRREGRVVYCGNEACHHHR